MFGKVAVVMAVVEGRGRRAATRRGPPDKLGAWPSFGVLVAVMVERDVRGTISQTRDPILVLLVSALPLTFAT